MLKVLPALFVGLFLCACASTITNITVSKQKRNTTGMYPVEAVWDTRQATVRPDTLKAFIKLGFDTYPMRPVLGMSNRFETVVAVPADRTSVSYFIRFDYEVITFKGRRSESKLSQGYRLEILD
jgi:hypothetical protein